jgi:hypothetical protein
VLAIRALAWGRLRGLDSRSYAVATRQPTSASPKVRVVMDWGYPANQRCQPWWAWVLGLGTAPTSRGTRTGRIGHHVPCGRYLGALGAPGEPHGLGYPASPHGTLPGERSCPGGLWVLRALPEAPARGTLGTAHPVGGTHAHRGRTLRSRLPGEFTSPPTRRIINLGVRVPRGLRYCAH